MLAPQRRTRLAYAAVLTAALLWAVGGTYASSLIERGASPVELTEGRAWVALIGLGLIVLWQRRGIGPETPISPWTVGAFGVALGVANMSYYVAIAYLPVAVAIVLQYTGPGLVVLWKALVEKRMPTTRVIAALFLSISGVVMLSEVVFVIAFDRDPLSGVGLGAAAIASVSFAAYVLLGERVSRSLRPVPAMFYAFIVSGAVWVVVQLIRGEPTTLNDPQFYPAIAFLGIATSIAPFLLFIWGLKFIDASAAGIASTFEPVGAALLAWLFLSQSLTAAQVVGAVAVIVGIGIIQSEPAAATRAGTRLAERSSRPDP